TKCARTTSTPSTTPLFQVTCQNMTVAEFAERVQQFDLGGSVAPLTDATGIEGRWDFKVSFTPTALQRAIQQAQSAARTGALAAGRPLPDSGAADPSGTLTLLEAIDRQLGLKVQMRRRPVPVLVVDSFDDKPTDN